MIRLLGYNWIGCLHIYMKLDIRIRRNDKITNDNITNFYTIYLYTIYCISSIGYLAVYIYLLIAY